MNADVEFESLRLDRGSVGRFLVKYGIGHHVPYRTIYEVYLSSPEWRERKAAYFSTHAKRCAGCGELDNVHLHHKTYAHFTQERDEDLVAVCETCHQWIHHLHRSSPLSLAAATDGILSTVGQRAMPDPTRWVRPAPGGQGSAMDAFFSGRRDAQRVQGGIPLGKWLAEQKKRPVRR